MILFIQSNIFPPGQRIVSVYVIHVSVEIGMYIRAN